jgi:hypothetical protein|tara:strand:- start:481 stop:792 length:312 start_codon:yes stop_codon:yes gene_type:complete
MYNFVGTFKIKTSEGEPIVYNKGDVVEKEGRKYIATRNVEGMSPEHGERSGWKKLNENRIESFSYGESPPEKSVTGDEWIDSTSGNFYRYITNDNGVSQWVEF